MTWRERVGYWAVMVGLGLLGASLLGGLATFVAWGLGAL